MALTLRAQHPLIATRQEGRQAMNTTRRTIRLQMAGVALALAGVFAATVQAAPDDARGWRMQAAGGPMMGYGPGGGHGPGMMHGGQGGPGWMMDGMMYRMLDRVNATPEQRAQIKQIVDRSAAEMRAQHESGRALRDQALALFAQPTVDANAAEALRQKQLALHDAGSKRMLQTMIEVSRVLTPEQRKQMTETVQQRRDMMQRHYRERMGIEGAKS
jgi:protein CpxP